MEASSDSLSNEDIDISINSINNDYFNSKNDQQNNDEE